MTAEDFEITATPPEDGLIVLRALRDCDGDLGQYKIGQYAWRRAGSEFLVDSPAFEFVADLWFYFIHS